MDIDTFLYLFEICLVTYKFKTTFEYYDLITDYALSKHLNLSLKLNDLKIC